MNKLDELIIKNKDETIFNFEIRRRLILFLYYNNFLKNEKEFPLLVMYGNMLYNNIYKGITYPKFYQDVLNNIIHRISSF